jgi:hypothetical protein
MRAKQRMAEYQAKPGQADPHGEMTGAITFNMILSMPPVGLFAVFIAPYVVSDLWLRLAVTMVMAVVLPLLFMPLSRRIWAWFSDWSDTRCRIMRTDEPVNKNPHRSE